MSIVYAIFGVLFMTVWATAWAILPWTMLGVLLALLAAYGWHRALKWIGLTAHDSGLGVWVRRLYLLWIIIWLGLAGMSAGMLEGGYRFARSGFQGTLIRTEMLDPAGHLCAKGLFILDRVAQNRANGTGTTLTSAQRAEMAVFEAGGVGINPTAGVKSLMNAGNNAEAIVTDAENALSSTIKAPPELSSWMSSMMWVYLRGMARAGAESQIRQVFPEITKDVNPEYVQAMSSAIEALPNLESGQTLTCQQISDHLIENGLMRMLTIPVRLFVRAFQFQMAIITFLLCLLPLPVLILSRPKKKGDPAQPPQHTPIQLTTYDQYPAPAGSAQNDNTGRQLQ